jgi:hypothetical protein
VLAVNPVTAYEVLVTVAFKYYLDIYYIQLPPLSVEAFHDKFVVVVVVPEADKVDGEMVQLYLRHQL